MSGPTRCVRGPFRIYVRGPNVAWVTFYVHGKRLRTVTHADAKARFTTTVNPRGMRARVAQRLVARVGGGIGVAVLRRSFTVCG
jgi:hypothetical protein